MYVYIEYGIKFDYGSFNAWYKCSAHFQGLAKFIIYLANPSLPDIKKWLREFMHQFKNQKVNLKMKLQIIYTGKIVNNFTFLPPENKYHFRMTYKFLVELKSIFLENQFMQKFLYKFPCFQLNFETISNMIGSAIFIFGETGL